MRTLTGNELILRIFACFQVICSLFYYPRKTSENIGCFEGGIERKCVSEIQEGRRAITFIITGSFANLYISTILSQWHIQRDFDTGIPVWVPKLCAQIKEKISLLQILEDKISIAIVSKLCKKFNFMTTFFLFF